MGNSCANRRALSAGHARMVRIGLCLLFEQVTYQKLLGKMYSRYFHFLTL